MADGIAAGFDLEMFLWFIFRRPDGGTRIWYVWTAGGQPIGDEVDQLAMGKGLDAADWLHIEDRHQQTSTQGRVEMGVRAASRPRRRPGWHPLSRGSARRPAACRAEGF
ncbi:hypothetical protein OHS70_38500 (plasmid) [Streptomyces sp. NBC_00390]|uniref:hypothetical protein n=1 Tax=Streptomyces sp. NBC_00390 TaxID=2975736 RepID=UPI002E2155EC